MELLKEIKSNWKLDICNKLQEIASLRDSYPAWTIKTSAGYGVAVLYDGVPASYGGMVARDYEIGI